MVRSSRLSFPGVKASLSAVETPFGEGLVAWTGKGVIALEAFVTGGGDGPAARIRFREIVAGIAGDDPADAALPDELLARMQPAMDGHTRGAPLDLSPFEELRRDVYRAVTKIPYGTVASYADVARDVKRPRAWRAVGNALRRCPVDLLIPAHRVVPAGGRIGGPNARSIEWKRALLLREGVRL